MPGHHAAPQLTPGPPESEQEERDALHHRLQIAVQGAAEHQAHADNAGQRRDQDQSVAADGVPVHDYTSTGILGGSDF
jgi:hypothetical protein